MKYLIIIILLIVSCSENSTGPIIENYTDTLYSVEVDTVLEVQIDTVYNTDTVYNDLPGRYRKINYSVFVDTGSAWIYWVDHNYNGQNERIYDQAEWRLSQFNMDSLHLHESIFLEITGDLDPDIKAVQNIIGVVKIDGERIAIDTLKPGLDHIKIGGYL